MTYEIKKIKTDLSPIIVYAISFENPLHELDDISKELSLLVHSPCDILFDLLLSNGDEFNRFVLGRFDGTTVDYDSLRVIDLDDTVLVQKINSYYHGKYDYLNNSVLSMRQRTLFAKKNKSTFHIIEGVFHKRYNIFKER